MVRSVRIGSTEIILLLDVTPPPFDLDVFFPDVPIGSWAPYKEKLSSEGKIQTYLCGWLIKTSTGRNILVDTGFGPGPHKTMGGVRGDLLKQLALQDVTPEEVDSVVVTHLHGDHIGWNVSYQENQPRPTFPQARYYLPRNDWEHFVHHQELQIDTVISQQAVPLQELGCLELVEGDYPVAPEVTTVTTPGHTPGHLSIMIVSQGEKAIIVGDLFHHEVQITESDWCAGADMLKQLARKTRHTMLDHLEREGFILAAGHLPLGSSIGKIIRLEGRRYWKSLTQ